MPFNRILIALDGSAAAAHAGEVGMELAGSLGAEVALAHAVDPGLGFAPESGVPAASLISQAEQDGKALLAAFQTRRRSSSPRFEFVQVGKPVDVILETAAAWEASMIVLATHGRGGMQRLLLGSVAEGVMRRSTCPVLVVRHRD